MNSNETLSIGLKGASKLWGEGGEEREEKFSPVFIHLKDLFQSCTSHNSWIYQRQKDSTTSSTIYWKNIHLGELHAEVEPNTTRHFPVSE